MKSGIGSVKHIIAIASGKGGVGKSTVCANLAIALNQLGHSVGVLDGDIYGPSQANMLGKKEVPKSQNNLIHPIDRDGIKFISMAHMNPGGGAMILRAPIAIKAISQFISGVIWGDLDYLLIDLPPGTGDIQLTLAQQARLSAAIIVTTPQKVAVDVARKGLEMFQTLNVPILGVIENMSGFICSNCDHVTNVFNSGGGKLLAQREETSFLGAIPLDPLVAMGGDEGIGAIEQSADSSVSKVFKEVAKNVVDNIDQLQSKLSSIEPAGIKIFEDTGEMEITWKDEAESKDSIQTLNPFKLRLACPCASCVDENTGEKLIHASMIPMDIKITQARSIGRYGLNVHFSDGHTTGIYKYTKLREMDHQSEASEELTL